MTIKFNEKCNCEKDARYMIGIKDGINIYSCNKHKKCPTYNELKLKNKQLRDLIDSYDKALDEAIKVAGTNILKDEEGKPWYDVMILAELILDDV